MPPCTTCKTRLCGGGPSPVAVRRSLPSRPTAPRARVAPAYNGPRKDQGIQTGCGVTPWHSAVHEARGLMPTSSREPSAVTAAFPVVQEVAMICMSMYTGGLRTTHLPIKQLPPQTRSLKCRSQSLTNKHTPKTQKALITIDTRMIQFDRVRLTLKRSRQEKPFSAQHAPRADTVLSKASPTMCTVSVSSSSVPQFSLQLLG